MVLKKIHSNENITYRLDISLKLSMHNSSIVRSNIWENLKKFPKFFMELWRHKSKKITYFALFAVNLDWYVQLLRSSCNFQDTYFIKTKHFVKFREATDKSVYAAPRFVCERRWLLGCECRMYAGLPFLWRGCKSPSFCFIHKTVLSFMIWKHLYPHLNNTLSLYLEEKFESSS